MPYCRIANLGYNPIQFRGASAMGLIEDLKALEELHAKGRLTDEEFAAAKSAAISGSNSPRQPGAPLPGPAVAAAPAVTAPVPTFHPTPAPQRTHKTGRIISSIIGVIVIAVVLWVWMQQNSGDKSVGTLFKEAVRLPVDLNDETFGISAASWKAIAIQMPYDGALTITVQVLRGNPMDMFLTDSSGLEQLKTERKGTYVGGFYSVKGTSFYHTQRIRQGQYYFVVWDRSLGILSSSSSDISLKARAEP